MDADGLLDLYAPNYLEFDPRKPPGAGKPWSYKGIEVYCSPENVPGQAVEIYSNAGSSVFDDMRLFRGAGSIAIGVVVGDFDDDGDQYIYVANDGEANWPAADYAYQRASRVQPDFLMGWARPATASSKGRSDRRL